MSDGSRFFERPEPPTHTAVLWLDEFDTPDQFWRRVSFAAQLLRAGASTRAAQWPWDCCTFQLEASEALWSGDALTLRRDLVLRVCAPSEPLHG